MEAIRVNPPRASAARPSCLEYGSPCVGLTFSVTYGTLPSGALDHECDRDPESSPRVQYSQACYLPVRLSLPQLVSALSPSDGS